MFYKEMMLKAVSRKIATIRLPLGGSLILHIGQLTKFSFFGLVLAKARLRWTKSSSDSISSLKYVPCLNSKKYTIHT